MAGQLDQCRGAMFADNVDKVQTYVSSRRSSVANGSETRI